MQEETIFAPDAIDTIFNGKLEPLYNKIGGVHHYRVRGFRYEDPEVMRAGAIRIVEATRIPPDGNGVYFAQVFVKGHKRAPQQSGFFPQSMTRDEIVLAISRAYEKRELVEISQRFYRGKAGTLNIYMFLDENARVIDAYPKRSTYTRMQQAIHVYGQTGKVSKYLCPVCLQPKVRVCASGHWPPRRKFFNRMRYRTRRAWFGLWRGLKVIK